MELQVTRNASLPVQTKDLHINGVNVKARDGLPRLAGESSGTGTIHGVNQHEMAEINGSKVTVGEEQLMRAIERALKEMIGPNTSLEVKIHEQTRGVVMRVMNRDTGELIREVPPERTLDIVYKMMEIAGLLFDEKV